MRSVMFMIQVIIAIILFSLIGFYFAIRPMRITGSLTPQDLNLNYENVSFKTKDNLVLNGWFIPAKIASAKTIILLHGYPADKSNILPAMAFLHENYNLFLFDFRYFGKSEGHYSTAGKNEVLDLHAAIRYLRTRGIFEVGVWGFSMGGAVALMAAPQEPAIKAIVSESSYARLDWMAQEYYRLPLLKYILATLTRFWGWLFLDMDINTVSPVKSMTQIHVPILLIYSKQDEVISYRHGQLLDKVMPQNPQSKVIVLDQSKHGEIIQNHERIINEFFASTLPVLAK